MTLRSRFPAGAAFVVCAAIPAASGLALRSTNGAYGGVGQHCVADGEGPAEFSGTRQRTLSLDLGDLPGLGDLDDFATDAPSLTDGFHRWLDGGKDDFLGEMSDADTAETASTRCMSVSPVGSSGSTSSVYSGDSGAASSGDEDLCWLLLGVGDLQEAGARGQKRAACAAGSEGGGGVRRRLRGRGRGAARQGELTRSVERRMQELEIAVDPATQRVFPGVPGFSADVVDSQTVAEARAHQAKYKAGEARPLTGYTGGSTDGYRFDANLKVPRMSKATQRDPVMVTKSSVTQQASETKQNPCARTVAAALERALFFWWAVQGGDIDAFESARASQQVLEAGRCSSGVPGTRHPCDRIDRKPLSERKMTEERTRSQQTRDRRLSPTSEDPRELQQLFGRQGQRPEVTGFRRQQQPDHQQNQLSGSAADLYSHQPQPGSTADLYRRLYAHYNEVSQQHLLSPGEPTVLGPVPPPAQTHAAPPAPAGAACPGDGSFMEHLFGSDGHPQRPFSEWGGAAPQPAVVPHITHQPPPAGIPTAGAALAQQPPAWPAALKQEPDFVPLTEVPALLRCDHPQLAATDAAFDEMCASASTVFDAEQREKETTIEGAREQTEKRKQVIQKFLAKRLRRQWGDKQRYFTRELVGRNFADSRVLVANRRLRVGGRFVTKDAEEAMLSEARHSVPATSLVAPGIGDTRCAAPAGDETRSASPTPAATPSDDARGVIGSLTVCDGGHAGAAMQGTYRM